MCSLSRFQWVTVLVWVKGGERGGKKEGSKTDCRVSILSTASQFGGAEASSVWIRAEHSWMLEDLCGCCEKCSAKQYCGFQLTSKQGITSHFLKSRTENYKGCMLLLLLSNFFCNHKSRQAKSVWPVCNWYCYCGMIQVSLLGRQQHLSQTMCLFFYNTDKRRGTVERIHL